MSIPYIKTGSEHGINVYKEDGAYIVETPASYDIYYSLLKNNGTQYGERLQSNDRATAVFAIPASRLNSDAQVRLFNEKINEVRGTAAAINKERTDMQDVLGFDLAKDNKTVAFLWKLPEKNFAIGEVVKAGKYFAALKVAESEDKVYVRMLNTSRFLQPGEFKDREAVIQERLQEGSVKYLRFTEDGKIQVKDYTPKQKAEAVQQPTEAPAQKVQATPEPAKAEQRAQEPSEEQKAALLAFISANGRDWKDKLSAAWASGNYRFISKDNQALLQQVRNDFGPEWLAGVYVNQLALSRPVPASKEDQQALKKNGQAVTSHMDAQTRWGEGQRLFAFHEQDGKPVELKKIEDLEKWTPDQLMALPAKQQKQEKQQSLSM